MTCSTVLSPASRGLEGVDVGGLCGRRGRDDLVGQRLEVGALRDEVGLGVQLDQRAVLGRDQTFGSCALGALADVLCALDPQQLDGLVEVAVGIDERILASRASRRRSDREVA